MQPTIGNRHKPGHMDQLVGRVVRVEEAGPSPSRPWHLLVVRVCENRRKRVEWYESSIGEESEESGSPPSCRECGLSIVAPGGRCRKEWRTDQWSAGMN